LPDICKISKLGQQKTTKNTIFDIKISEKVKNMQERWKAKKQQHNVKRNIFKIWCQVSIKTVPVNCLNLMYVEK